MPHRLAVFLLSALLYPAFANAETARVPLGAAVIEYDREVWTVTEPVPGVRLEFACIAADCASGTGLLALARERTAGDGPWFGFDPTFSHEVLAFDPGRQPDLPFLAIVGWSGCRALDNPAYSPVAELGAFVYWIGSAEGCNFGPELPAERFLALVAGVMIVPDE